MGLDKTTKTITTIIVIVMLLGFPQYSVGASQDTKTVALSGYITSWPIINITINTQHVTGTNKLSLGFTADFEWKTWRDRPVLTELAQNASFKLIRVFDFRKNPSLAPCTSWNENTKTGVWDWTQVDLLAEKIFEIGAEPFFSLGTTLTPITNYIPSGMASNPDTGLPYPESWAAYCKEWPKHFKSVGLPVRFYETMNEPWAYFGWDDYTKIGNFMAVFNAAAQAMRAEDPNVLVSFDGTNRKPVLDYWLSHGGADLGYIAFHKYDSGTIGQYTDSVMLDRAETYQLKTSSSYYGVKDVVQVYYNSRGDYLPVVNSESNFNSACDTGTDPKIQQLVGTVWEALVLRTEIIEGADYNIYYNFASSASWELSSKTSGGVGFGMVNSDNNKPYYPYYVQEMVGRSLSVSDSLLEATSTSANVRVLAWSHNGSNYVLLIGKTMQTYAVSINGILENMKMTFIDGSYSWDNPVLQHKDVDSGETIIMNGYSVILLQTIS